MRRALRALSSVLIVTGVLLVADAVLTVVWQEPLTAIYGAVRQDQLASDLSRLERAQLPRAERAMLTAVHAERARIALLASDMKQRARSGQALGRVKIPRIGVSFVVVEGTDAGSLRKGPGHYPGTALPGMPGTVAIAGHRTTYLAPFNHLDALRAGDLVRLEMPYATVSYRVQGSRVVDPTALWVTKRVGYNRLVLTACEPKYSAARRLVVFARQVGETERGVSARIR